MFGLTHGTWWREPQLQEATHMFTLRVQDLEPILIQRLEALRTCFLWHHLASDTTTGCWLLRSVRVRLLCGDSLLWSERRCAGHRQAGRVRLQSRPVLSFLPPFPSPFPALPSPTFPSLPYFTCLFILPSGQVLELSLQ
jgi:hypothetical protein